MTWISHLWLLGLSSRFALVTVLLDTVNGWSRSVLWFSLTSADYIQALGARRAEEGALGRRDPHGGILAEWVLECPVPAVSGKPRIHCQLLNPLMGLWPR